MHDYKFRQGDLSLDKPKRNLYKKILGISALAVAAASVYGIVQLGFSWQAQSNAPEAGSDIIPLTLPPHAEPEESTPPPDANRSRPAETPSHRAFTNHMNLLHGQGPTASFSTASKTLLEDNKERLTETAEEIVAADPGGGTPQTALDEDAQDGESGTWIEHEVKPGDSLAKIFQDNDLSPQLLQNILRSGKEARYLKTIRPKDRLRIHLDRDRQFTELQIQLGALQSVKFVANEAGIRGTKILKETESIATAVSGVVDRTLFSAASKAGLPDAITMKMAKIFGWDIDFALAIRRGDRFTVIYEELWADGKQVGSGNVIAAEFVNKGRAHRAIRYTDSHGKTDYYSPEGVPLKKSFFRTPVKFTRISSRFSNRRWHPVLKRARAHKGVDYAAPKGTPIIATGDGTVEFRGWKGGYGRVLYLRHGRKYRTVYGHMSKFAKGLSTGDRVKQGQIIGYVGRSGLATGPHLHYEFHVNGIHRNPLDVKMHTADPLPTREVAKFHKVARPLMASLEQTASDTMLADAR